ncbi:MAG TPA: hypothetical protein VN901_15375 [Candidatus Acidoferrales bacterium]|nr:hypothetical protein [Candidatus Acidoferrales bacterium]
MKNKSPLNRRIQLAIGSAILTLPVVGVPSYHAIAGTSKIDGRVQHTKQVISNLLTLSLMPQKDSR